MSHVVRLPVGENAVGPATTQVFLTATVRNAFGEQSVKIREIGPSSAVIQASVVPPAGSRLLLIRGAVSIMGTVTWTNGNRYSLEFQGTIDTAQLLVPVAQKELAPPVKPLFPVDEQVPGPLNSKH